MKVGALNSRDTKLAQIISVIFNWISQKNWSMLTNLGFRLSIEFILVYIDASFYKHICYNEYTTLNGVSCVPFLGNSWNPCSQRGIIYLCKVKFSLLHLLEDMCVLIEHISIKVKVGVRMWIYIWHTIHFLSFQRSE